MQRLAPQDVEVPRIRHFGFFRKRYESLLWAFVADWLDRTPGCTTEEHDMGVAERFYEAFMVRDHYTMGLLYAEHATFSDPVFPLLNAKGARLMWQMLLSRAEDLGVEVKILEDSATRARVDWVAYYTFKATGRPVVNRIHTEMAISAGKIVRQVDTFSLWRWTRQALGVNGLLLGWTPIVRNKVRAQAAQSLREFARRTAANQGTQETR